MQPKYIELKDKEKEDSLNKTMFSNKSLQALNLPTLENGRKTSITSQIIDYKSKLRDKNLQAALNSNLSFSIDSNKR